jgi:hypothetical protein
MQVEPSDPIKVSQEVTVLIEALPPVLIPSQSLPLRHSRGWRSQESQACSVFPGARNHTRYVHLLPSPRPRTDRGSVASDIMVPTAGRPVVPARFTLDGVLYHHGTSPSGGLYKMDAQAAQGPIT